MSPEISERSFEEAIECGLLQYGPDSCVGRGTEVHETMAPSSVSSATSSIPTTSSCAISSGEITVSFLGYRAWRYR